MKPLLQNKSVNRVWRGSFVYSKTLSDFHALLLMHTGRCWDILLADRLCAMRTFWFWWGINLSKWTADRLEACRRFPYGTKDVYLDWEFSQQIGMPTVDDLAFLSV